LLKNIPISDSLPEIVQQVRLRTPARLLAGRSGGAYLTTTQLELRAAHAAARDAVRTEFNLEQHLGADLLKRFEMFEVSSAARSKDEYLLRPDLGRQLSGESRIHIAASCPRELTFQVAVGDGLSTAAVAAQVPVLLPLLMQGAKDRGWTVGRPFAIRFCRVGILNEIGEILHSRVTVLLIGERPGLATAESLSAYMAFRPKSGHTDANRNLISNIHQRGISPAEAAVRILNLADKMMTLESSGACVREELPREMAGKLPSPQL
jgi:ethanolamine ammonia-lyase small subunit